MTFRSQFQQLILLLFRSPPWFSLQSIAWKLGSVPMSCSSPERRSTTLPASWRGHLLPNSLPWPWRWLFCLYRAVLRSRQLCLRFYLLWWVRGWYRLLSWLRPEWSCIYLPYHSLGSLPGVEGLVDTKSSNVGMGSYSFDPSDVLDLRYLWGCSLHLLNIFK